HASVRREPHPRVAAVHAKCAASGATGALIGRETRLPLEASIHARTPPHPRGSYKRSIAPDLPTPQRIYTTCKNYTVAGYFWHRCLLSLAAATGTASRCPGAGRPASFPWHGNCL